MLSVFFSLINIDRGPAFTGAVSDSDKTAYPSLLLEQIDKLPDHNRRLLRDVMQFLHVLSLNEGSNHMTAENLAIVMAPNIIRMPSTFITDVRLTLIR